MTINYLLILTGLVIVIILILFISKKMCDMVLRVDIAKKYFMLVFTPEQKESIRKSSIESINWLNQNTEDVEIISRDGLKLRGYKKENKTSNIWIIVIHGYMNSGADMVQYAKKFLSYGYNVLVVDLRAHGQSEGKYLGMGWLDRYDIELWIEKIIEENKNCKIVLYGLSMGAATVTMVTGDAIPEQVKLAIADCGYTSVWEEFKIHLRKILHIHPFPLLYIASLMSKIYAGYRFKEASSIKQVKKSKIPTLFIHGTKDKFVPYAMLNRIYKNANCKKEKLEIEDAGHAESSLINPEKYWSTVEKFINKYI